MTLEEKIGQLNQLFYLSQFMKPEMMEPGIRDGKIGSLLFVTDPSRVVAIPTRDGYTLLLSVSDPGAFLQALRGGAPQRTA